MIKYRVPTIVFYETHWLTKTILKLFVKVKYASLINIVYKKELQSAEDKEKRREELKQEYADAFFTPFRAADLGFIDEIIEPNQTRIRLVEAFELLENKRETTIPKKHGNIPL